MKAFLILLLADASGPSRPSEPALPAERLGNVYTYREKDVDQGLEVERWMNETLGRLETWHKPAGQQWLKLDERTYVRGIHEGGEWRTVPECRMILRGGRWRTIRVNAVPGQG